MIIFSLIKDNKVKIAFAVGFIVSMAIILTGERSIVLKLIEQTIKNHKKIIKVLLKNPNLKYLSKEEQELPYSNFESEDYKEGLSAFLNHQNPNFQNK